MALMLLCAGVSVVDVPAVQAAMIENENARYEKIHQTHDLIASVPEANAFLYAKKSGDEYEGFVLQTGELFQSFPDWENVMNPTYAPQMWYVDINRDGEKEIVIVLTTGTGSGVLQQEVHVLHGTMQTFGNVPVKFYDEVLVDNPMAIVLKNVRTKLSPAQAEITIGGRRTIVDLEALEIEPGNLFQDVGFGNTIRYEVADQELIVTVWAQVSPAGYIGEINIAYEYRDKMYQAKRIEFVPSSILKK